MSVRAVAGVVAAAVACVVGALILGEYEFTGITPVVVGVLFGLVISEIVVEIGRLRTPVLGILCALMTAGALWYAGWVSSGEGLRPLPTGTWVAMACGAAAAGWRTGGWRRTPERAEREDVTPAE